MKSFAFTTEHLRLIKRHARLRRPPWPWEDARTVRTHASIAMAKWIRADGLTLDEQRDFAKRWPRLRVGDFVEMHADDPNED